MASLSIFPDLCESPAALKVIAQRFHLLGDPRILRLILLMTELEATPAQLANKTGFTPSAVKESIGILKKFNLITLRHRGMQTYFKMRTPFEKELCDLALLLARADYARRSKSVGL